MPDPAPPRSASLAERLFVRYLSRLAAGEAPELQSFCREQPSAAEELLRLHADFERVQGLMREAGLGHDHGSERSLARKLVDAFGTDVDPEIALDEPGEGEESRSTGLIQRLSQQGPKRSRYQVRGELAQGGMGSILKVFDQDLRRSLAMKVMLGDRSTGAGGGTAGPAATADRRLLARFLEEAQITGQLDHPGIVPVHEVGLDSDGRVYFTMKLVKGRDLKHVFELVFREQEGWNQTRALGVLLKVCEALGYAHAKGVIHRDLKPGNVMVGSFGEVFVMDWGLSRVLGRKDAHDLRLTDELRASTSLRTERAEERAEAPDSPLFTMDGDVVGTPCYMPPEQARGEIERLSPRSDVYAIGAMLYHLLTRQMPYAPPGSRISNRTVLALVIQGPPIPIHKLKKDVPAELVAICEKAMAREPSERHADTQELAADLRAFLEHRVVRSYQTGALVELRKWVERNRPLAASIAAGFLAVVAGLIASWILKERADWNAQLAQDRQEQAETRRTEVLRLSALQKLEDLVTLAGRLWPVTPERIEEYRAWIAEARELVAELSLHRAKRDELRALALPQSTEERRAERESHADYPALVELERELAAKQRALAQRRDGQAAELPMVDWNAYPTSAVPLNEQAWQRVDPDRRRSGDEPLGLVLARRAHELAAPGLERAMIGDTLAWAYFALGMDDEAADASAAALEEAPEQQQSTFQGYLTKMESAVERASSEAGIRRAEEELAELGARRDALGARVDERRDWRFPLEHGEARWWLGQLTKLIEEVEALGAGLLAEDAVVPGHGWSVPKRLAFAERLRDGFAPGGEYAAQWATALPAVRASVPGLELGPQLGLVPLGTDPGSGLWEFAHLQTGAVPGRGSDGQLVLNEETGLVFVLLAGGTFLMGAQKDDPGKPNHDPVVLANAPLHEVMLSAFFLSKYELTQGQWLRATGGNPSQVGPHNSSAGWLRSGELATLSHPVENVTWSECARVCARLGLALPSEAQWEWAARGGTDTPWWTGTEPEALAEAGNVADAWARDHGATPGHVYASWDDGATAHAPAGTCAPNPFGLHEVIGNVWEWCQDGYFEDAYRVLEREDPVAPGNPGLSRVRRGGSFALPADLARSAFRGNQNEQAATNDIGLRPACPIPRPAR